MQMQIGGVVTAAAVGAAALGCPWTCPCLTGATRAGAAATVSQVQAVGNHENATFYRVPLMCHAARGLGCGSRAKPVLLDLQKRPIVKEAWLNQTGEILAVVWGPDSGAAARQTAIAAVADAHGFSMEPLEPASQDAALADFRSGTGWHRGADVDQLSAQEARIIAARLLHRASTRTPSVQQKAASVEPVLTEAIRRELAGTCRSAEQCRDALLNAARPHLVTLELAALKEAIASGFQPVGDER